MDEFKTAVVAVGGVGRKAEADFYMGRGKCIGERPQPLGVELKILVERPLLTSGSDGDQAAVRTERRADFSEQSNLGQVGFEILFVACPADRQLKAANLDLGTTQIAAGLGRAASLSPAKHLAYVDFYALKAMRQRDLEKLALPAENSNTRRT